MLFKNYQELLSNGTTPLLRQKRADILSMLAAGLDAVNPSSVLSQLFNGPQLVLPSETIDFTGFDHIYLVSFGKASVGMAEAVCKAVPIRTGVVITADPSARVTHDVLDVFVGGHPLPNFQSISATDRILDMLHHCTKDDCVIVCISGGGSSLFCKPRVPLPDLQETITLLLRAGATIDQINTIRKHLSLVKGGQLVKQTKAMVLSLIISDVVHDPVSTIASGPTAPDPTTFTDAENVLQRYDLWQKVPEAVRVVIHDGIKGTIPETIKENDPAFSRVLNYIVANNETACNAVLLKAREIGYDARLLTTDITGEARVLGQYMIKKVRDSMTRNTAAFISGGEPTVTMHGAGVGGRNQEFVLGCVEDIAGTESVVASFATDGVDGNSTAAGAIADGYTLVRAQKKYLFPPRFLMENNSYVFFSTLGDILRTGFTGTNVMDIQIILQ